MSYEVLARKLRPSGFDALVGQEHVVRALSHALDNGRLHHAYLFTGTRGVGKTTIARILAKSLNCEKGVSSSPCGECSICNEVRENRFIDLIEVDAASRTGVDDTRDLLENAQYMPARGRYKVYLIDEVHMLSIASFNALLKTLEEPPEHVKFLLATTDPKKVPVTVLSRCLQFQLKNISLQAIADYICDVLAAEEVVFETAAVEVIARSAEGSMRDALSLTDQAIAFGQGKLLQADVVAMLGVVGRDEVSALLEALAAGSAQQLMQLSAELAERNADFYDVLKGLLEALHSMSVEIALGDPLGQFEADELQLYYQIVLVGMRDLPIVPDQRSGFEMTLLRMLAFAPQEQSSVPPRSNALPSIANSAGQSDRNYDSTETKAPEAQRKSADAKANEATDNSVETSEAQKKTHNLDQGAVHSPSEAAMVTPIHDSPSANVANENAPVQPAQVDGEWPDTISGEALQYWYELVNALAIGGVAKMIAEHSVPIALALPEVRLLLSAEHDMLLSDVQSQNLQRALSDLCEQKIALTIDVGNVEEETPAVYRARLALERQLSAEQTLREDATVKSLLADFDGKIDGVTPI
jgi:DNA polymerase-3 subunit gamma/tau